MTVDNPVDDALEPQHHWTKFADALAGAGKHIYEHVGPGRSTEEKAQVTESAVWALFDAVVALSQLDRDYPDWVPLLNGAIRRYNGNADTTYCLSYIRGSGVYQITGRRGTVRIVHLQVLDANPGLRTGFEVLADFNLDDCDIAPDGTFEILLSPERPTGHDGNWFALDPQRDELLVMARQVSYDWSHEIDAQLAIQRLDRPGPRPRRNPADVYKHLLMIPTYVQGETLAPIDIMKGQIESAPVNQLTEVTRTLPTIGGQAYTHGLLDFGKDQAWVAECEIPAGSPYWGVQLMDYAYNTLDVMYTQASLNGHSARVDSDGKVRIVVCEGDPGAANWLDLGGHERVQIRFRWFGSEQPRIVTRLVPLAELHESLPSDTSTVSPGERQAALRERARGMQLRRRW